MTKELNRLFEETVRALIVSDITTGSCIDSLAYFCTLIDGYCEATEADMQTVVSAISNAVDLAKARGLFDERGAMPCM